jgi:hypothetical protein
MILNFYLGKSRKLHLLVFTNYFTLEVPGPQLPLTYGGHSQAYLYTVTIAGVQADVLANRNQNHVLALWFVLNRIDNSKNIGGGTVPSYNRGRNTFY